MPSRFTPEVIQMLEHIPNALYALDKELRFIFANKRMLEFMFRTEEEIIGKYIWDVFQDYNNTPVCSTINTVMETGEVGHSEQYYPRSDKWYEVYAYPSPLGVVVYVNNVTERKKSEQHLLLLNKASERLAMTHDTDDALEQVGKQLVPGYADWFTVDCVKKGVVELLVMANEDPEKVKWGKAYRANSTIDIERPKEGSVGWVIRLGVPLLINDVNEAFLARAATNAEHLEVLKQLQIGSAMIVPMPYRGKNMGAVTFLSGVAGRYDARDLEFAKDLAIRIGLSLENTRLFEEARRELAASILRNGIKVDPAALGKRKAKNKK